MTPKPKSFRQKILNGVSWSTLGTIVSQGTNLLTFLILGKFYLDPSEFGLVAMVLVLTGFAAMFTEFGLGAALIQKQETKESHISSVFWLNLLLGFSVFLVFILLRNPITAFYEKPELHDMIAPLAFTLVLASICTVHVCLLRKDLRFKSLAIVSVTADILSTVIAIGMAEGGAGVWALVGKSLSLQLIFAIGVWLTSSWRPKFMFCLESIKEIFNFGFSYFGTRAFSYAATKMDQLMIGKFIGDVALGLYSNAFKIVLAPIGLIKNQVVSVFFPALSTIQNDKDRIKVITLKLSGMLAIVGFPLLFFAIALSGDMVRTFLDESWADMEFMLVLLSFIAMAEISIFPGVIFLSRGRADQYFWLMLWTKSLSSIGIVVGVLTNGIIGLLIGMLIAAWLNFLPYIHFSARLIGMTVQEQLLVNLGPFLISAVVACIVVAIGPLLMSSSPDWLRLVVKSFAFLCLTCISFLVLKPYPLKLIASQAFQPKASNPA